MKIGPTRPWLSRLLPAFLGAVLLNVALLILLTQLSRERPVKEDFSEIVPVHLVQIDPPEPPEESRPEPPKPPKPKPQPRFVPDLLPPSLSRIKAPALGVVVDPSRFDPSLDDQFVFEATDVDQPAQPIARPKPMYPERARRLGIEGVVTIRFLVVGDGTVQQVEILSAKPSGVFEETVLKTVPSWRFRPGSIDGKPVSSWWSTDIEFKLDPW